MASDDRHRVNHRAVAGFGTMMPVNRAPVIPVPVHPDNETPVHVMREGVATKLLAAWLANRRQTLMPHTLNFRALAPAEVALLIETMAAAAQADGAVTALERDQASLALALVNADPDEARRHEEALATPQPLSRVLDDVRDAGIGAHAYASALLAIDRSSPVCQAFLAYLAARLSLPPDLAQALESRYRT